ncbi:MAG TPA: hypothetical protein VGY52_15290 [Roseiarcus sp.]|jgi:hypothetical protein|nr:hypothetical protein [Roseiarcus sp.]
MGKSWMTKWGSRKVREIPPTLEEAFVAAECLTEDLGEKIEIAASLMGLPVEEVRAQAAKLAAQPPRPSVMTGRGRPVVVQYKRPRLSRPAARG